MLHSVHLPYLTYNVHTQRDCPAVTLTFDLTLEEKQFDEV